jgi:DNA/RNA-binding domain of Phe-tRNA-synthetase-like protein
MLRTGLLLDMRVTVRPELRIIYPRAAFGSLQVRGATNTRHSDTLEAEKRALEKEIRERYPEPKDDGVVQGYAEYFTRWGKTYPIEYQIKSLKAGRGLPRVSVLVDCMFMAELKNRILTSGHDLDTVVGEPLFDVSDEGEEYVKLNGERQVLPRGDVVLRDGGGVLASVLYGPARRTSISPSTVNALYFAWCPTGMGDEGVQSHLSDIEKYLSCVYSHVDAEAKLHR